MRVAIDARSAIDAQKTGVGFYTWHLIHRLPEVDPATAYVAWYLHARGLLHPQRFFPDVRRANFSERASRFPARLFSLMASRFGEPKLDRLVEFDVLFAPNFIPPPSRGRKPVVVTVHDVAFRRFPETAGHLGSRWHAGFRRAIETAARILVPSSSTREDLGELYGVDPARVDVVPLGAELTRPDHETIERTLERHGIDGPYVLFLGGIERRKNLPALLRAYALLPADARPALVVAGGTVARDTDAARRFREALDVLPPGARVIRTGYVSDEEKAALLSGAEALIYPSLYEGFGFPVLEAMAVGTPVVTSNSGALPEVAGDDAVLVDPSEPEAIARGLAEVLGDETLRARLREAGPVRAASYTWERTAGGTADALHRATGER